jgi:hypothetical protein
MIFAGHGADIGAPVARTLGFIMYAAEREAHEVAACRLRDRLAERGLADARRTDQAQDRPGKLVGALMDGEIFNDALLDLLNPVMVVVEDPDEMPLAEDQDPDLIFALLQ